MLVSVVELPAVLLVDNAESNHLVISEWQKLVVVAGGMFLAELAGPQAAEAPCSKSELLTEVEMVFADAGELFTLGHKDVDIVT